MSLADHGGDPLALLLDLDDVRVEEQAEVLLGLDDLELLVVFVVLRPAGRCRACFGSSSSTRSPKAG